MAISLNGVSYSGGANPTPPTKISQTRQKAGTTLIMASGLRVFVGPGTVKRGWKLSWANANEITRPAVAALTLTTTFTYVDPLAASHTVQIEADAQTEDTAFTTAANTLLYDLELTIWQAD